MTAALHIETATSGVEDIAPLHEAEARESVAWKPTDRERLIYKWVRFDGEKQSTVADRLDIHQATVSRSLQRYERWLAHLQPGEDGQLAHEERLRVQRWLTFERNELMLAAALRIAGEMEGFTDVSKSTIRQPAQSPSQATEVRTEHTQLDRSGVAARFLRLAFRINMEQLKLAELEALAPLAPLSADEIESGLASEPAATSDLRCFTAEEEPAPAPQPPAPPPFSESTPQTCGSSEQVEQFDPAHDAKPPLAVHKTHPMHTAQAGQIAANTVLSTSNEQNAHAEEFIVYACIGPSNIPAIAACPSQSPAPS